MLQKLEIAKLNSTNIISFKAWFELPAEQNTKVYVDNLPLDITEDEFEKLMSKCGMIFRDPTSNKMKIKLYSTPEGQLKGDGLCTYIRVRYFLIHSFFF